MTCFFKEDFALDIDTILMKTPTKITKKKKKEEDFEDIEVQASRSIKFKSSIGFVEGVLVLVMMDHEFVETVLMLPVMLQGFVKVVLVVVVMD
ncbi:hypothetical protein Lal_00015786 [Lupinus albus]|nr:hypothetical protein Lal_00015786 [Lupinus albus]